VLAANNLALGADSSIKSAKEWRYKNIHDLVAIAAENKIARLHLRRNHKHTRLPFDFSAATPFQKNQFD